MQSKFRLLVVRLSAMGDILHALPAVAALRQAHPCWQIGWAVEPRWRPLLAAASVEVSYSSARPPDAVCYSTQTPRDPRMPLVDWLHFAPTKAWGHRPLAAQTFREIRALRDELRNADYDAVLDLQGSIRSAVVGRLSSCPRRLGELTPREGPARLLFTEWIATRGAHVAEQDVELASAVAGDALTPAASLLPIDAEAELWCDGWLAANSTSGPARPIALILPGAGWGAKRWPPERYLSVAQRLRDRGFLVVVNAGPGEEQLAAAIAIDGAAAPLTATLPQLIAFTRRAALVVGGDTGPLHLAAALGRPVVGIYGPTDPSRNGPFGTRARILRSPGSRRDHTRRAAPDPGLFTIAPDDVLRAAAELLAEEKM
jgi:heptosyltransferase-1